MTRPVSNSISRDCRASGCVAAQPAGRTRPPALVIFAVRRPPSASRGISKNENVDSSVPSSNRKKLAGWDCSIWPGVLTDAPNGVLWEKYYGVIWKPPLGWAFMIGNISRAEKKPFLPSRTSPRPRWPQPPITSVVAIAGAVKNLGKRDIVELPCFVISNAAALPISAKEQPFGP